MLPSKGVMKLVALQTTVFLKSSTRPMVSLLGFDINDMFVIPSLVIEHAVPMYCVSSLVFFSQLTFLFSLFVAC